MDGDPLKANFAESGSGGQKGGGDESLDVLWKMMNEERETTRNVSSSNVSDIATPEGFEAGVEL